MTVKLGKVMNVNDTVVNEFNQLNFNFTKMKTVLQDAVVHQASVYLDKKLKQVFIYLEVENLNIYYEKAKMYENAWWSELKPLTEVPEDENNLEYAWHDVFGIKDEDSKAEKLYS